MPTVSLVVPFLNEEDSLPACCAFIEEKAQQVSYGIELLFVDDGSSDDSVKIISEYPFLYCESVHIISLTKNFGSHAALRAGIKLATGDYCTYMGADLDEPEAMLDVMYDSICEGYDAVCIDKISMQVSAIDRATSLIYSGLIRKFAVKNYSKNGINNIMFNKKIIQFLNSNVEANSSIQLQIINAGYKSTLIGMKYRERVSGASKWTFSKKVKLFIDSFVSYSYTPIRFVSIIGFVFAFLGLIFGLYTVFVRILSPEMVPGYATIIVVLLFGFGLTNISLGIMAEYLWRTFDSARNRPVFIVDDTITVKEMTEPISLPWIKLPEPTEESTIQ
jgi:dolichol-phosphate mannosyltransferase